MIQFWAIGTIWVFIIQDWHMLWCNYKHPMLKHFLFSQPDTLMLFLSRPVVLDAFYLGNFETLSNICVHECLCMNSTWDSSTLVAIGSVTICTSASRVRTQVCVICTDTGNVCHAITNCWALDRTWSRRQTSTTVGYAKRSKKCFNSARNLLSFNSILLWYSYTLHRPVAFIFSHF